MSVLQVKILWYRIIDRGTAAVGDNTYDNPINITDALDLSSNRGLEIRNNSLVINLKNSFRTFDANGERLHRYVDESFNIRFEEQDQIKLWLRYTDDFAEVEDVDWQNNTNEPADQYLRGTFYVIEFTPRHTERRTRIRLKCADKTYIIFNKLLAQAFPASDGLTAPEIIQQVVRYSSENTRGLFSGTGADSGVRYDIDARLVSEGGEIQDTRRTTKEDGSVNADTNFPDVSIAKVWKPVYEWINELSQFEYLNTDAEKESTLVYGRPFIYFVDENNVFRWKETDTTSTDTFTVGTTKGIYDISLTKAVFDVINFVVFRGGEDLFGVGTLGYEFDQNSDVKSLKMRVEPLTYIAKNLIESEIQAGNLVENTSGAFTFSGNRYDASGYPLTPEWQTTSVADDSEYNSSLRDRIISDARAKARSIVQGLSQSRFKGNMDIKGQIISPGALITVTDTVIGVSGELLRVTNTTDQVNKKGWFTKLTLEEDAKAVIAQST